MKSKHLLHLLMMALLVPGIVNAQNLPANSPKSTSWQEITINSNVSDKPSYYVPIGGDFVNIATSSQFIIPASSLQQIVGCTLGKLTFYTDPTDTATKDYGDAIFKVYMLEVPNDEFISTEYYEWESLTQVYQGTLSVSNYQMVVDFDTDFGYSGDNLLIGFDLSQTGTSDVTKWLYQKTDKHSALYSVTGEQPQPVIPEGENKASLLPKMTITYQTSAYPGVNPVTSVVSGNVVTLSWVAPEAAIGYAYQYKLASGVWPATWTETQNTSVEIANLVPSKDYDFRVKALYAGSHESVPCRVRFTADCPTTPMFITEPYTEDFDAYTVEKIFYPVENVLPSCWERINNSTDIGNSVFPTMYFYMTKQDFNNIPFASSGGNSLMFGIDKTLTDPQPQYLILPQMQHIQLMRVTCQAVKGKRNVYFPASDHTSTFHIGVMEENGTFTSLGTFTPENYTTTYPVPDNFMTCTVDFSSYTGSGTHIAFWMEVPTTTPYGCVCIDDIVVEYAVDVPATFTKIIDPWTEGTGTTAPGGWYLISSPLAGQTNPADVQNMLNNTNPADFDLYRFEQNTIYFDEQQHGLEWENWKANNFNLEPLRGYLYANRAGDDLTFSGVPYYGDGKVTLSRVEDREFTGWNLIGNPWATNATITKPYYRMNAAGNEVEPGTGNVAPMEAVFVIADQDGETETFTKVTRNTTNGMTMALNLSHNNDLVIDRAILRFDEGYTLPKFQLNPNNTKVYIPQNGKDYAVVNAEGQGEMPINFRAAENGYYTLALNNENVAFSYLHLIDNMTSADIDLLSTPSYTFKAKTTDYESRFRLVYVSGNAEGNESFGFFNESGNFTVYGIEGEATLQMIDVMGRVLSTENFNGNIEMKVDTNPGIYMFRLINGDNVKVQKVVVK